jgi:hypothetical protein
MSKPLLTPKFLHIAYDYRQAKSTRPPTSEQSRQNGTTSNGDVPAGPTVPQTADSSSSSTGGQSHQDRIATAKEKALKRVQERLAAAGIKTGDTGESLQQRQERERKEREDRVKKAEAEDAKREQERQQRLAKESGATSPSSSKSAGKKPPPPPSRKGRQDSTDLADKKAAEAAAKARADEDAARELKAEQEAQQAQRQQLEYVYHFFSVNLVLM